MSRPPGDAAPDGEGVPSTSEVAQVTETSSVGASIEVEPLTGTSAVESLRSQSISSSSSLFLQKDVLHSLTKSGQESLTQIVSGKDVEPEIWKSLLDEIFGKSEGCKTGDIQASFTRAGAKSIEPTLDAHETNKRTYEEGEVKVHIKENPLQIDVEGAQETRKYRNLDVEVDKGPAFISLAMPDYEGKDSGKSFVMSFTADGKIEKMNPPLEKIKIGKKDGMPYFEDGGKSIPIPLSKDSFKKFRIQLEEALDRATPSLEDTSPRSWGEAWSVIRSSVSKFFSHSRSDKKTSVVTTPLMTAARRETVVSWDGRSDNRGIVDMLRSVFSLQAKIAPKAVQLNSSSRQRRVDIANKKSQYKE